MLNFSTIPKLLHDNAPNHKALVTKVDLRDCGFDELSHMPYLPDLAPCNFHLFPNLKGHLSGKRLKDNNELKTATKGWIQGQEKPLY